MSITDPRIPTMKFPNPENPDLPDIIFSVETITPEIAREWLEANTKNRNVRSSSVRRYRSDMENGRWDFTGDPVRFDYLGNLLDGQHRLLALTELDDGAGVSVLVIRNLPTDAQMTMDQGSRRSPGDQLSLRDVPNASFIASGVKRYLVMEEGLFFQRNAGMISTPAIESWVESNPRDVASLLDLHGDMLQIDAPPSVLAAAALVLFDVNEGTQKTAAVDFFTTLSRGGAAQDSPITLLDRRLARIRREKKKVSDRDYLGLIFTAWNAWRDGRTMSRLTLPRGGTFTEDNFPMPH